MDRRWTMGGENLDVRLSEGMKVTYPDVSSGKREVATIETITRDVLYVVSKTRGVSTWCYRWQAEVAK